MESRVPARMLRALAKRPRTEVQFKLCVTLAPNADLRGRNQQVEKYIPKAPAMRMLTGYPPDEDIRASVHLMGPGRGRTDPYWLVKLGDAGEYDYSLINDSITALGAWLRERDREARQAG